MHLRPGQPYQIQPPASRLQENGDRPVSLKRGGWHTSQGYPAEAGRKFLEGLGVRDSHSNHLRKKERDGRTPSDAISVTACWVDCLLLFGFCVWFLFGFSFSYARLRRPRFSLCSCVPLSLAVSRFPSLVWVLVIWAFAHSEAVTLEQCGHDVMTTNTRSYTVGNSVLSNMIAFVLIHVSWDTW